MKVVKFQSMSDPTTLIVSPRKNDDQVSHYVAEVLAAPRVRGSRFVQIGANMWINLDDIASISIEESA